MPSGSRWPAGGRQVSVIDCSSRTSYGVWGDLVTEFQKKIFFSCFGHRVRVQHRTKCLRRTMKYGVSPTDRRLVGAIWRTQCLVLRVPPSSDCRSSFRPWPQLRGSSKRHGCERRFRSGKHSRRPGQERCGEVQWFWHRTWNVFTLAFQPDNSIARARARRDITVPSGTPVTLAISR